MKKIFSIQYITLWCFVLFLGCLFLPNLHPFVGEMLQELRSAAEGEEANIARIEENYNARLPGRTLFVTINGGFCRLLGQRALNERYKLDNGQLTYVIPELDMSGIAANTVAFKRTLEMEGIPFLYINTPFKVDPENKQLPPGVEDYSNENADRFLNLLRESGVDILDLREREKAENLDHSSLFYRTDHHWKAETGFWAFTEIVRELSRKDSANMVDESILAPENYKWMVYPKCFLGSAGRRVGPLYSGLDDMTVITPAYDTWLRLWSFDIAAADEGTFSNTLMYPEFMDGDMFHSSPYDIYLGGNFAQLHLLNESRERGFAVTSTQRKILVFTDSFAWVVAPFLALSYDETVFLDLRTFEEDVLDFIREEQPDLVIVLYNPGALEDNNWNMFQFLPGGERLYPQ